MGRLLRISRRLAEAKNARKFCNECLWLAKAESWRKRCCYQDKDGHFKSWLERRNGQQFGLGCKLCSEYYKHCPDAVAGKVTPYMTYSKGQGGKLQIEDCLRHGNHAKAKQFNKTHHQALEWFLGCGVPKPMGQDDAQKQSADDEKLVVTTAQILLSQEVVFSPLAAQGGEYHRRCLAANRTYCCSPSENVLVQ